MKKRAMKRLWCLLLAISMFLAISIPAAAASADLPEPEEPSRYTGLYSVSAFISKVSNGKAECISNVSLRTGYTASLTMSLQKQSGSWTPICSWSTSGSGNFTYIKQKSVSTGYSYRCRAYVIVYDSNGNQVETATVYSSSIYI